MDTPRLVESHLVIARRLHRVAGPRRIGEEPKGVEVGAGQGLRLDDRVAALGAETQGEPAVTHRVLVEPVDHGPLVQRETPEVRGAVGGRCQEGAHEGDRRESCIEVCRDVQSHPISSDPRKPPRPPLGGGGILEVDADAGVPTAQGSRLEGVIGEEEILSRVTGPRGAAGAVTRGESVDAGMVGGLALTPLRFRQHPRHGRTAYSAETTSLTAHPCHSDRMTRRIWAALAAGVFALVTAVVTTPAAVADPSAQGRERAMGYYLAMGDSLAAGYQPGMGDDRTGGYVGDVLDHIRSTQPKTRLVNIACSGETTVTLIDGGRCAYDEGSQLAAARSFLAAHGQFTRVVTIDIGANDITRCAAGGVFDQACFVRQAGTVHANLRAILAVVQAGAPHARIVVLNYYNPFLAAWLTGPAGQELARTTTGGLIAFNAGLSLAATTVSGVTADVSAAFDSTTWMLVPAGATLMLPLNVLRICQWTWMCAKADIHANDTGYAVLAAAVNAALDRAP